MLKTVLEPIRTFNAGRELKKYAPLLNKAAEGCSASQLAELLFSPDWERFFWIKQLPVEIKGLGAQIEKLKAKIIVEIGTNQGGSLFLFTKVADKQATIISIDLPDGPGGGGYADYRTDFYKSFAAPSQKMHLMRADSHLPQTLLELKRLLNGELIDFLFLDGDHTYEGIKQDFEMYAPLVRKGGLIAFHDIKPSLPDNWIQVGRFWNTIKSQYAHREVLSEQASWGGIGMLTQN